MIILTTVLTWLSWCFLIVGDTPTNVFRNVALIAGGFVAWIFAFWRSSIAERQVDLSKNEYFYSRYQRLIELLSQSGIHKSYARTAGFHSARFLAYEEPELALEIFQITTAFMFQTPVNKDYDPKEFNIAERTASYALEILEGRMILETTQLEELRADLNDAITKVAVKLNEAGIDPTKPTP